MSTTPDYGSSQCCLENDRRMAYGLDGSDAGAQPFCDDRIARIHCTDIDELAEQVRDWNVEVARLSSGPFRAAGLMIPLDSLLMGMCMVNQPLLTRTTPPAGCFSIILSEPGSDPFVLRGRELAEGHCVVISADAQAEAVSRGKFVGYAVAISEDAWRAASDWAGDFSLSLENGVQVRAPGTTWTVGVLDAMRWILDAFARHPQSVMSTEVRASLADFMMLRLHASADTASLPDNRREHSRRRIAVERARDFIHENLTNPIRLSQLCAHAHLQARSLEYGFMQILGMSPISYVKAMRLNRAHRLLLSTDRSERTVTEIALDCGFWHLSQFAADYRKFFGESPRIAHRALTNHTAAPGMVMPSLGQWLLERAAEDVEDVGEPAEQLCEWR